MKFSVVTVTFNAVKTVEETIKSVSSQNNVDIEYIIIDGNSTDGTVEIIKSHSSEISYWISEPDKGIYDAMNKALNVATGDYLIFMGADDVFYETNTLEKVKSQIDDETCIYYGRVVEKNSGNLSRGPVKNALDLCRVNISHQSIFYPRFIYKAQKYQLKYRIYADYVYNLELYAKYQKNFRYIDQIITVFNENGASGQRNDIAFEKDRCKIASDLFGIGDGGILWVGLRTKAFLRKVGLLRKK